jgi:hypothetical protein
MPAAPARVVGQRGMTMTHLEPTGFGDLDRLAELVRRTRELLDVVAGDGELPAGGADFIAERTLPHLDDVQSGFHGWLRSDSAGPAELRHLLLQVGALRVALPRDAAERRAAVAEALAEAHLRASKESRPLRLWGAEPWALAALAHARLVLAFLPRVPEEQVRFPAGRRTYADIAVPRGPAELASRIEELEEQLWRAATGHPAAPFDPAFRRTYGFFDAAERLGRRAWGLH